jgi:hypothetical protein
MGCEDAGFKSRRGHAGFPEDFCGIHQSLQAKDGMMFLHIFSNSTSIIHPTLYSVESVIK